MNKNLKQKLFNFKNICIFMAILITIFIIVLLLKQNKLENKVEIVYCYLENTNYTIKQRVEYKNDVFNYLELEQRIDFKDNNNLKISTEQIKNTLDSMLKDQFDKLSDSAEYFVKAENNAVVYGYNLNSEDYKKLEKNINLEKEENITSSTDNFYDDKFLFIQRITNLGGECNYE